MACGRMRISGGFSHWKHILTLYSTNGNKFRPDLCDAQQRLHCAAGDAKDRNGGVVFCYQTPVVLIIFSSNKLLLRNYPQAETAK